MDASRDNWLVYSGMTVAPFSHIHEPGLRVRFAGGYGHYGYSGDRSQTETPLMRSFAARTFYGEALAGYLEKWGPLTAKAFAGVSMIGHAIQPFDTENAVIGDDIGFKAVIELWLDIGTIGFASLDMSWSTTHDVRSARARVGTRISQALSAGVEGWLNLDAQSDCDLGWTESGACARQHNFSGDETDLMDYSRAGLFLRYAWDGGEISVSGGVSGGSFMNIGDADPEPYGTVNWITQF